MNVNKAFPCWWAAQHRNPQGSQRTAPLTPHPSPLTSHPSPLTPHPSGLSIIVNTPNETTAALFRSANMSLPGLRWGSHADSVKARLPKLILYSRTEFNGTTYYAWKLLQTAVQAECTIEKQNCTLS